MNSPFVQRLLLTAPEFCAGYECHLRIHGELLPHLFMSDVTRAAINCCTEDGEGELLTRLLNFFEHELAARDKEAEELISLGFCENLLGEVAAQDILVPKMGPLLFKAMKMVRAG